MEANRFDDPNPTPTGPSRQGNRPASGARHATPGEVFDHHATDGNDFLGLEDEVGVDFERLMEDPELTTVDLDGDGGEGGRRGAAWLMQEPTASGSDEAVAIDLDADLDVGTDDDEDVYDDESLDDLDLDEDALVEELEPAADWGREDGEYPGEYGAGEEVELDVEEGELVGARSGGGLRRVLVLVLASFALGGAAMFGSRLLRTDGGTEVAQTPPRPTTPTTTPTDPTGDPGGAAGTQVGVDPTPPLESGVGTDPVATTDPVTTDPVTSDPLTTDPVPGDPGTAPVGSTGPSQTTPPARPTVAGNAPPAPIAAPLALASVHPLGGLVGLLLTPAAAAARADFAGGDLPIDLFAQGGDPFTTPLGIDGPLGARGPASTIAAMPFELVSASGDPIRVGAEDVAMIWRGERVPVEAIEATSRVLTPGVGGVRVLLDSGEVFEGRLYAVGQSRVWLDIERGRMALTADRVATIQRIEGAARDGLQTVDAIPGERVRVRTAGGFLVGRILAQDEKSGLVTILTDSGGRITLERPEIEPSRTGTGIVIDP